MDTEAYGLDAKGYKYETLEKLYDLAFPVILFWNFNHFVTLEGFNGDKVFLNDPAQGPLPAKASFTSKVIRFMFLL